MSGVFLLRCCVQNYAWGKLGLDSEVARLQAGGDENFVIEEGRPYAELWMGTHPKGPAILKSTGTPLSDHIKDNPTVLGAKVQEKFNNQLPFLFKILSVNKALSIQAHPNKSHAEELHARDPEHYPDANHKPEMAIALTRFEGLCGFRPIREITGFIEEISELRAIVGEKPAAALAESVQGTVEEQKAALKDCFSALMMCESAVVKQKLDSYINRVKAFDPSGDQYSRLCCELLTRLNSQFPGDRGCFSIYFLNHLTLEPGQALFLRANLPHAYLAGNCIECMACSDNVVRAGLTPKFIDVPTLCSMLDYTCCESASDNLHRPVPAKDQSATVYDPPVPDFTVTRYAPPDQSEYTLSPGPSAGILLVVQGQASSLNHGEVKAGSIFFIHAGVSFTVSNTSNLLMYMAHCVL